MKKSFSKGIGIALMSLLFVIGTEQKSHAQDETVSYQSFYDNLAPYGQWVSDQQYGNVWVPNEGGDFRPYGSRGHWVMTDYGNTWVSDDPWGWACYHYGRWTYDNYYGWVWVPGYEWAPAWVSWRYGGGYSGWAPLGPGINVGMSYNCPESWWVFVQPQYMYEHDCYSHWRGPSYNGGYIRQTTVINNYYMDNGTHVRYNYGPHADVIQRDTHQPVQVYHVAQMRRPGAPVVQNNRVSIYRPEINQSTRATARPNNVVQAPRQVGRPQAATNVTAGRQPEFRQQMQKQGQQPQNTGVVSPRDPRGGNSQTQGRPQQGQPQLQGRPMTQPQTQGRPQQAQPQQQGRPQQAQPQQQGRPQQAQPQQQGRPQQAQPQQQGRPQQAQPQQQSRPQQAQPQQQGRPQQAQPQQQSRPQQTQPQQQSRPEPQQQARPQMQQQPMSKPEPQQQARPQMQQQPMSRPEPQQQARPQMQQQPMSRPEPQHEEAPRQEAPRMEGGGGRR